MKNNIIIFAILIFIQTDVCFAGQSKIIIKDSCCAYANLAMKSEDGKFSNSLKPYKYNLIEKTESLYIIKSQHDCFYYVDSLDLLNDKLALLGSCVLPSELNYKERIYSLLIVDVKTEKEIAFFNFAKPFSFSPKGDAIVYAERIPGAPLDPVSTPPGYVGGVWLYDFITNTKKQIFPEKQKSHIDINWSEHDGNIYITNYQDVYQYNPKNKKLELVPYKGIYFSPDGKYYVQTGIEGPDYLYRTCDNKRMSEWENLIMAESKGKDSEIYFGFWSKKTNSVVFRMRNTENVIFDLGKGKVIGKFYGWVLGTNAEGSLVAVNPVRADNQNAYDQSQVEIINLLDVVSKYKKGN